MSGYDDLAQAIRLLDELGPDDPRVHKAFQSAIDSEDLADDDTALAHLKLGGCWHDTGKQNKAKTAFKKAIKLTDSPAILALANHELGETYFALGEEAEAEKYLRESLAEDRQHSFAPDTLILLGRILYVRIENEDNLDLVEESYRCFDEALAMLESPSGEKYGTFFGRTKALFDAFFGKAICMSDMPSNKVRFEAVPLFERAEQIALENPEQITRQELENTYKSWAAMLNRMGLERDVELVINRAERNLG